MEETNDYSNPLDEEQVAPVEADREQILPQTTPQPREDVFERFAEKLAASIAEAEQRGYCRAIEAMKEAERKTIERDRSVPNFLSDVRRDMWEGE